MNKNLKFLFIIITSSALVVYLQYILLNKTTFFRNPTYQIVKSHNLNTTNHLCKPIDSSSGESIARKYMERDKGRIECDILGDTTFATINEHSSSLNITLLKIFEEQTGLNISHKLDFIYSIKLNVKYILKHFKTEEGSLICRAEKFDKKFNVTERNQLEIFSRFTFEKKYDYTIFFENYGFYYVGCFEKLLNCSEVLIYDETYNIFPRNMSKFIDERREYYKYEKSSNEEDIKFLDFKNTLKLDKKMNVLMIGLDSMSSEHLRRSMPLTYEYLTNQLTNSIMYTSVNIVGENTVPNIIALLTGVVFEDVDSPNITSEKIQYQKIDEEFYDKYPFIWYEFEKLGYLTGYQVS
jgi:hypothetical protein